MFKAGDWVVFKSEPEIVYEIASYSLEFGYDVWNEDAYYLAIDEQLLMPLDQSQHLTIQQF